MSELDAIDRKLVTLLQADGRTPHAELGKAVGLAVSSVNERVRKLVERGVITGIHAHVAPEALGLELLALSSSSAGATLTSRRASSAASPASRRCSNAITSPGPGTIS